MEILAYATVAVIGFVLLLILIGILAIIGKIFTD